jgi:hypothetical protein
MTPSRPLIERRAIRATAVTSFLAVLLVASSLCGELEAQVAPTRGSPDAESLESSGVQPGEIRGVVIDAETGEPLEGAQVYLENTMRGALTDSSGRFHIEDVPDGSHVRFDPWFTGIRVAVRDVLTGRAPATPAALRVTRDSIVDWDLAHAVDASALGLGAGSGRGTFTVEVAADGYARWYREDVRVEGECAPSVTLNVWLIPVDPEP